jgi:hypothetical protein
MHYDTVLCILLTHNSLNKYIGLSTTDHCHITIFLCINNTGEHHSLSSNNQRTDILLSDIVMLLVATNDLGYFDGTVPLLLYKDVGLKDMLLLIL